LIKKEYFVDVHNTIDGTMIKQMKKTTRSMKTDWKSKNRKDEDCHHLLLELKVLKEYI
jgi:uncharacterized lipoprotein